MAEFNLRNNLNLSRDALPGLALHRPDGTIVRVWNENHIMRLTRHSDAIPLIDTIQKAIHTDQKSGRKVDTRDLKS